MKSQQQELSIKTNCKDCAFAIYDNNTQVSCEFDRVAKFGEKAIPAYDENKEFYVIDTLCCYYRDKAKGYTPDDKNKVVAQSSISFDLIVDCNDLSEQNRDSILDFLATYLYFKNKVNIVLVHQYDKKEAVKSHVEYIARSCKAQIGISVYQDMDEFLNDYILKTKNLCHMIVKDASKISKDILLKINSFVNDDLGKFLVISHGDHLCISSVAYKLQNMRVTTNDYDANVNTIIKESKEHRLYIEI